MGSEGVYCGVRMGLGFRGLEFRVLGRLGFRVGTCQALLGASRAWGLGFRD